MTKVQLEQERNDLIALARQFLGRELATRERKCLEVIDSIVSIRFLAVRFPQVAVEQDFEAYFVDYVDYCEDTLGYCLTKLSDMDDSTRFSAVEVLRGLGPDSTLAIPKLCELLKNDPDEQVRAHCAFTLSELARFAPESVLAIRQALEHGLGDSSAEVVAEAEAALERL